MGEYSSPGIGLSEIDRPFLDAEHGCARHAIEDEQQALLRVHRHGRNRPAVALDVDQRRRRVQVVVPVVVMRRLKKPLQLAGRRVQREQRRTIQIRAQAIAAVEICGRRARRDVRNPARLIDGNESPRVRSGAIDPLIVLPRVVIGLTRPGNRVERPDELARPQIPGTNIARRSEAWRFLRVIAGNREVPVDRRRRRQRDPQPRKLLADALPQIDLAALSESLA